MEEEQVPGPRVPDEALELPPDVGPRGLRPGAVVDEDADAGLVEAEALDEAAAHARDVVVAALELRLGARVVDPHQHRALLPHRSLQDDRIRRRDASIGRRRRRLGEARRRGETRRRRVRGRWR